MRISIKIFHMEHVFCENSLLKQSCGNSPPPPSGAPPLKCTRSVILSIQGSCPTKPKSLNDSGISCGDDRFVESEPDAFDAVQKFVEAEIIVNGNAVTLEHLTTLAGKDKENRSHRSRVKEKLQSKFTNLSL